MNKFIAIDGNSLMYRAFFALPAMTSRNGIPTNALHGFLNMLIKLLDYEPSHIVVAFDMHAPTFRHKQYDAYKAGRPATPGELIEQMEKVKQILREMNITVCECEGFEADDILGTLTKQAGEAGLDALIVTGDKDALQLISPKVHVLLTKKGISEVIEYSEATLFETYGLRPDQMVDLKGLMGDNSDNLPGIKGVGEKTALKLLAKYGNLQETLDRGSIEEKGSLQQKIITYRDDALLSYKLGTITTAAPVTVSFADCAFDKSTMQNASPTLAELELKSIMNKLPGNGNTMQKNSAPSYTEPQTIQITSIDELKEIVANSAESEFAAIAFEKEITIAFAQDKQYSLTTQISLLEPGLDIYEVYNTLAPVFESKKIGKILFDAKKVMHKLSEQNIQLNNLAFDAMIADYILNAVHPSNTLGELVTHMQLGTECAATLYRLSSIMVEELKSKQLYDIFSNVEMPLIEVLYDMEKTGFYVDINILNELNANFTQRKADLEEEIFAIAGTQFNIQSPKQLSDVLFNKLQLTPPRQKTTQGYSTSAEVLENYDEPIVKLVLEYRFVAKLKSTFIDGLISQIDKKTGRVHTTFNQNVTATGRISSTEPNLQNIPTRTDAGREIRRAFTTVDGNVLADADYSQIELRVLAHMSNDKTMIDAFRSSDDIHTRTAAEVFRTDAANVTSQMRSAAKAVNFGIVYGISEFGLAKQLGISRKRAGEYIHMYLDRYPGVNDFMHNCIADAAKQGYAVTLLGRRRELYELHSSNYNTRSFGERIAMNMPVQGSAADIIKIAMIHVYNTLKKRGLKAKLVLQIHDELIVDSPIEEIDTVKEVLQECMEKAFTLSVPLIADVHVGNSWYDAK